MHAVVAHADQLGLVVRTGLDHLEGGRVTHQRRHPPVVGTWGPTALHVAEDRDPGVLTELLPQQVAHALAGDRPPGAVLRTFGDHHDALAASGRSSGPQPGAHHVLPPFGRRVLGDEHVVGAARDRAHQREVAAVPAHHLDHERPLMARSGAGQRVDRLDDPVQGRVRAHRHVGSDHVVVDRADHAGDHQVAVPPGLLRRDLARLDELGEQLGPLGAEQIGPRQGPVPADHHDPVDAVVDQVAGGPEPTGALPEVGRPGGADQGPATVQDRADRAPVEPLDPVAAVDEALQALVDRVHVGARADSGPDHCADHGVHALGVAARGEHRDRGPRRRGVRVGGGARLHVLVLRSREPDAGQPRRRDDLGLGIRSVEGGRTSLTGSSERA